ncbi:MAG: protein TolR [Caulobacterales bacterium]
MAGSLMGGGRGRRRDRRRGMMSEINVTPFVDVMLVLLIVFMVTAPLLTAGIEVELPQTRAEQMQTEADPLSVTVQADGTVFLQNSEVAKDELLAKLTAIAEGGYDRRIFIRADTETPYGAVADIMAMLSTAGYRNLGLVTDPQGAQPRAVREPDGE